MQSRKSRDTWSNRRVWPWSTQWSRRRAKRVLSREHIGHSKHPFPTTQEKTTHGRHRMINVEIRLPIFSAVEDHYCFSVAKSCPALCDPMDCSTPSFPVHHQLPELVLTRVHWVGDAIQPSHLLSSLLLLTSVFPSIRIFTNEFFASGAQSIGTSASASVLPMNIQDWFPLGLTGLVFLSPRDSLESYPTPQFKSINSSALSFFMIQLSDPYLSTGKTTALTIGFSKMLI